jgi:hypothetical protein
MKQNKNKKIRKYHKINHKNNIEVSILKLGEKFKQEKKEIKNKIFSEW